MQLDFCARIAGDTRRDASGKRPSRDLIAVRSISSVHSVLFDIALGSIPEATRAAPQLLNSMMAAW
ncbi:MAG: hypothetical protein R3B54_00040 [Bdellovibrionota bacterium]